jgi:hypothetical protein
MCTRNREDVGSLLGLQPQPQPPIIAIDALTRHPGSRHLRVERVREHLACQLWLCRTRLLGDSSALTACTILHPIFRQGECTVQQGMALATGLGQTRPPTADLF